MRLLALAAALAAVPLVPGAQPAPAAPPPSPAPSPAPAAAPPPGVTVELGGWFVLNGYAGDGGLNVADQPRFAVAAPDGERTLGMAVRQSRLRAGVGVPADGLLGGARLRGLLELDFMGGYVAADQSLPIVRLRHAWVSAGWKEKGNLTVLLGQTWGVFTGPHFAASLSHLATPRFAGAGFLYRRAPQLRVSGELGSETALLWTVAALAPIDRATATASGAGVGERSGLPDLEARLAVALRAPVKLEVGLSGHYGQEKYLLAGPPAANRTVDSVGYAVDARLEAGPVTLVGAAFQGENLDVWYSVAPGVRASATSVTTVETRGLWAQAQVTPVKGLQLLLGGGLEQPEREDLPATIPGSAAGTTFPTPRDNRQASLAAIVNLASRWRVSAEGTRYWTKAMDGSRHNANQVEVSSLVAF
jgi:hypothetical protein